MPPRARDLAPYNRPASAASAGHAADAVTAKVLEIVAAKTGYPQDMLDLELDLEADLGIDTVKQAETFASIRQAYDIPPQQGLSLREYPTLKSVVGFVHQDAARSCGRSRTSGPRWRCALLTDRARRRRRRRRPTTPAVRTIGTLEDADRIPRRVPRPALRPPLEACKPTGVVLGPGSRVVVMLDEGCVGKELAHRLAEAHVEPLLLEPGIETAALLSSACRSGKRKGPIQGVYWLPALDVEPRARGA